MEQKGGAEKSRPMTMAFKDSMSNIMAKTSNDVLETFVDIEESEPGT